jgi:hypothetical protein
MTSHIVTASGRRVDPLRLRPEDVSIDDIAHALGMLCRFGGHAKWHYSVAQHSLLVASITEAIVSKEPARQSTHQAVVYALLHDASEAYLVDLPAPIKDVMEAYMEAEGRAQATIYDALGLPLPTLELSQVVSCADRAALCIEARALVPSLYAHLTRDAIVADIDTPGSIVSHGGVERTSDGMLRPVQWAPATASEEWQRAWENACARTTEVDARA